MTKEELEILKNELAIQYGVHIVDNFHSLGTYKQVDFKAGFDACAEIKDKQIDKLKEREKILVEALEHIADKNYNVCDEGMNYNQRLVCNELYSDKPLWEWARETLEKIRGE